MADIVLSGCAAVMFGAIVANVMNELLPIDYEDNEDE